MDVDRLKDAKDLFAKGTLSPEDKQKIQSHKEAFPEDDAELSVHLETLNVSELTEYLLWIPFIRFQNLEILGEGGFARVWKATVHWPGADEDENYALKEIDISMSPELILTAHLSYHHSTDATMRLIGLTSNTSHPDIKTKYLMILDRADGDLEHNPLHSYLTPTFWREVHTNYLHLARCLAALHSQDILHHDLHPCNVVFKNGLPRIIDIGLAAPINRLYSHAGKYGRLDYLPPEIFNGDTYTTASDIYCLGTLLWQIVTGVPPRGNAKQSRLDGMREDIPPGMPKTMREIICECWDPVPARRPSAYAVCNRLEAMWRLPERVAEATRTFIEERRKQYIAEKVDRPTSLNSAEDEDGFELVDGGSSKNGAKNWSNAGQRSRFFSYEILKKMDSE